MLVCVNAGAVFLITRAVVGRAALRTDDDIVGRQEWFLADRTAAALISVHR